MAWAETRQKQKQALCHSIVFIFSSYFDLCPYWATSPMTKQRNFQLHFFWFWYGGKGIQCWSFKLFLTLIICILFDIENVKFSKKLLSPVYYIIYSHLYLYCSARYVFLWIGVRIASNLKYLLCEWNCVSK